MMIGEYYKVKPGSDKEPEIYLGANIEKVQMPDGREVWASLPRDYVKNAIKTVEDLFAEDGEGYVLKNKVKNPFPMNYKPELDMLEEFGPELSSRYLQLIGICQWAIELGQIDIIMRFLCCHSIKQTQGLDIWRLCIMCLHI